MKIIVVSGLSGAGKGVAINALEDLGYWCVDNLPLRLLHALASEPSVVGDRCAARVGAVIDARSPGAGFEDFHDVIARVEASGAQCEVVFLEADDSVLLKRFSETRRKHPLTGPDISLAEAIERERELLGPIRERADICIDTTRTHLHELRDVIRQRVDERGSGALSLMFQSFGFKHGVPPDADMVFDARSLPNPYWVPDLRAQTGQSPEVSAYLAAQPTVLDMIEDVGNFLERWIPSFEADNRAYLTVAIGCTGGHHRSVFLVEQLARRFQRTREHVLVRHREL